MIESRLTIAGVLIRFAFFALNAANLYIPILLMKEKASMLEWCFSIFGIIFLIITSLIVVLTTRKISIEMDKITYTNWLTGKAKIYNFKDLDGYVTMIRPRRIIGAIEKEYESLILIKENKRIGEISSYYYSNYNELIGELKNLKTPRSRRL